MALERHSGDADRPRILGAFNEVTADWLAFFMFTYFTDRDGKYQLASLAESAFDPLARTCRFMLTEEAHHMFVGESGIKRVISRTAEVMRDRDTEDVRNLGVIDLETVQKYINFHYSVSLDLFGGEKSTNAAAYFEAGLKGRYNEAKIPDDHSLKDCVEWVPQWVDGKPGVVQIPAINALNERLREDFTADCNRGLTRWNKVLANHGIEGQLYLPHHAFNRGIGAFADHWTAPDGSPLNEEEWLGARDDWLPTMEDRMFVASLMQPCVDPGKISSWIAPPQRGINGCPVDYDYVRF